MPKKKTATGLGRPPKFQEPCSAITLTLPDRILEELATLDQDRAKAIVRCVEAVLATKPDTEQGFELVPISGESGIMIIGPCPALAAIPWIELVEITPARFLIALPTATTLADLELALLDLAESLPDQQAKEKSQLNALRERIGQSRRQEQISSRKIFLLNLTNTLRSLSSLVFLGPTFLADALPVGPLLALA